MNINKAHVQPCEGFQPDGLIISYEGLANPIIESQVLEHADELNRRGISCEVWFLCGTTNLYRQSTERLSVLQPKHFTKIRLLPSAGHNLPLSEYYNALVVDARLKELGYSPGWIQARTGYIGAVCAVLKRKRRFKFILDVRGDTLAEISLAAESRPWMDKMLLGIKWNLERRRLHLSHKNADAALFVSEELRRLHARQGFAVPSAVVPCVANPSLFFYDQTRRSQTRQKLGYSPNDTVICYSGSTAVWQCANETLQLISGLMKYSASVRALIISRESTYFRKLVEDSLLEKFTFVSAEFEAVNDYLNAADLAVLLRKPDDVNRVASPVKFAEYSMAGLKVIVTPAVAQIADYGSVMGNTILYQDGLTDRLFVNEGHRREEISRAAQGFYARENYLKDYFLLYAT